MSQSKGGALYEENRTSYCIYLLMFWSMGHGSKLPKSQLYNFKGNIKTLFGFIFDFIAQMLNLPCNMNFCFLWIQINFPTKSFWIKGKQAKYNLDPDVQYLTCGCRDTDLSFKLPDNTIFISKKIEVFSDINICCWK